MSTHSSPSAGSFSVQSSQLIDDALTLTLNKMPKDEDAADCVASICRQLQAECKETELNADFLQARIIYKQQDFMLNISWTSESIWITPLQACAADYLLSMHELLLES